MQLQCCREGCTLGMNTAMCYRAVCAVPLLSFPLVPLLQQCWAVACSSSPLSAASADVVAGAWSPGFTHRTAAGRVKEQRWGREIRDAAEWRVHLTVMSALQSIPFALFIHVWQSAGSRLESLKGIQLRQEFISWSASVACPQHRPERILVLTSLEIK